MNINFSKQFIIPENKNFNINTASTSFDKGISKSEAKELLKEEKKQLKKLQEKLYADDSKSLLIILQAMDAAGKDSLIEHVFGGVNPQGCEVESFKTPTKEDYDHDFLWRHYKKLPDKGKIGIFNRSHYESVLVCRVHPEYNLSEKVWTDVSQFDEEFWNNRYESIRNFEKHLSQNGTKIIKFFLHVSKDEQKQRFLDRINEEDKNWKFSSSDMSERDLWDDYQLYYEKAINETSTEFAPWFVLPADQKWFTRVAAIKIIIDTLEKMKLHYPSLNEGEKTSLKETKKILENKP